MDFTPTEEQQAACELAAEILDRSSERWKALCEAGLVAAVEEIGLLGLVLLLEEMGRRTAEIPLAATCAYGLLPVAAHGTDEQRARLLPGLRNGSYVATGAFPQRSARAVNSNSEKGSGEGWRLTGSFPAVPWLREATHVLVPAVTDAGTRLFWLPVPAGAEPVDTTAPWAAARLVLDGTPAEPLGDGTAYGQVLARARTAFAGLQAGVCAGSLARAVAYTSVREQFGRPLSTNQGVLLRAADAHMDTEAIRVTAYEAAWRYDQGLPAASHALTAAWWASEGGKRVVHAGQHLHGGIGADLEHPVHRHFLWGRQLDAYLGGGAEVLAELGVLLGKEETS
ncbi:acyl-CoA dehydrogenase family protein [Streptomyces sp. H10-C2]|uniref:acyl-CoA dehydrogenase family protein n=1 Tax=unclassified Streptomyces TaxID=2593676 RepID=UPI0024B905F0|nr:MULTISPECIES: acyl-CoA dehydrogenase family protein [unclassified Streptomyces]MDJ0342095.1 acyl-CoA dehydrogenase family protein [Streptomyces sp. PH10-H1]MDJ0368437.1 acyl-CoA dehydrogenase family protein [Streptomyces sp. H10-C2]